jgi:serine/threonine protein kinase
MNAGERQNPSHGTSSGRRPPARRTAAQGTGAPDARAAAAPLAEGAVLGHRYRIESLLGSGGMGMVYKAFDTKLGIPVALKYLRFRGYPHLAARLRQEIVLARRVTHENVCRVYDLEELDGDEYVSMEYLRGETLRDLLDRERYLPLGRGLNIAKQILRGVGAAHRLGVIHRDLKPENIFLSSGNRVTVMDFGIASAPDAAIAEAQGALIGTPPYMTPEMFRGHPATPGSDLYAVGIILYEIFAGFRPFRGESLDELAKIVTTRRARPVRQALPEFPKALDEVIGRALEKDAGDRYQTAEEFLRALDRYEVGFLDDMIREISVSRARVAKLLFLLEADRSLAATADLDELLEGILSRTTRELGAERGTIYVRDQSTSELWSRVLVGGRAEEIRLAMGQSVAGRAAAEARPLSVEDAQNDPRFDPSLDRESGFLTRNVLAVPLKHADGQVVGVLEVVNSPREFTKDDEAFLEEVAQHVTSALEQAALRNAELREARREGAGEAIRDLLRRLLPASLPRLPGWQIDQRGGEELLTLWHAVPGGALLLLADPGGFSPADAACLLAALPRLEPLLTAGLPRTAAEILAALGLESAVPVMVVRLSDGGDVSLAGTGSIGTGAAPDRPAHGVAVSLGAADELLIELPNEILPVRLSVRRFAAPA